MSSGEKGGCQNPLRNIIQIKMDPQEMIKMVMLRGIEVNKKHIEVCQEAIDKMRENDNPKDRLEAAVELEMLIYAMNISINGWLQWCVLKGMNMITEAEFKELLPKMKKLAIKWLEIDKKITATKTKDMEKKLKEFESKAPKKAKIKETSKTYVA